MFGLPLSDALVVPMKNVKVKAFMTMMLSSSPPVAWQTTWIKLRVRLNMEKPPKKLTAFSARHAIAAYMEIRADHMPTSSALCS